MPDKNEEEEEELLKPVWIRCTHSENYYSSDPMDQVVGLQQGEARPQRWWHCGSTNSILPSFLPFFLFKILLCWKGRET